MICQSDSSAPPDLHRFCVTLSRLFSLLSPDVSDELARCDLATLFLDWYERALLHVVEPAEFGEWEPQLTLPRMHAGRC